MQKSIIMWMLLLFGSFMGCAANPHMTIQKEMSEAKNTLRLARVFGADPVNSPEYKEAITNYSTAEALMQSGRVSKQDLQEASEKAQMATQQAELAISKEQAIKEQAFSEVFETLRNDINELKRELTGLKEDFVAYRERAPVAGPQLAKPANGKRSEPERRTAARISETILRQNKGPKVVRDIQFKLLAEKREEIIFFLESPLVPRTFLIKDEHPRLVCDFLETRPGAKIPLKIKVNGGLIKQIRTWHHQTPRKKLRIVIDLNGLVKYTARQKLSKGANIFVIQVQPT